MEIAISQASREDFADMIRLADLTLPDRMNLHELKKYFELFPRLIFKATLDGRLIGFSCAGVDMDHETGWLLFSNVDPAYQGLGIGKRLVEKRLSALQQIPSIQRVRVTVSEHNYASIKALTAQGFTFVHQELDYYGSGKHRNIMERVLMESIPASISAKQEPDFTLLEME